LIATLWVFDGSRYNGYSADKLGWPDMFPSLVDAGRKADIHVVWNKDGEIVGATVAALVPEGGKEGPMHESLAWPITLGMMGKQQ
jgi:hypothetical protein